MQVGKGIRWTHAAGLRKKNSAEAGARSARGAPPHGKGVFDLDDAEKLPYESPVMEVVELDGFDLRPDPLEGCLIEAHAAEAAGGRREGGCR